MNKWVLYAALALLFGCSAKTEPVEAFKATVVDGATFGRDFHLTDTQGKLRSLADFRGKVVLLTFGYTHCPDICPTTLAQLAAAVDKLGEAGRRVQVLFVTLDPARDTAERLGSYLPFFRPGFIGLRGDEAVVAAAAREFHVYYRKQDVGSKGGYVLDHSAGVYAFDPEGRLRLFMEYDAPVKDVVHDLRLLLRS